MAVMAREAWTDERLDDLNRRVEKGFDEVKGEVRELRGEIGRLDTRFDSLQQTMVIGFITLFVGIAATVIGGVFAAIALS